MPWRLTVIGLILGLLGGCNNYNLVEKLENPGSSPDKLYAFVTAAVTAGDMSGIAPPSCMGELGLARADCACRSIAVSSGLVRNSAQRYAAWLSTSADDMTCRLSGGTSSGCSPTGGRPWFNTRNEMVAASYADLFDGSLSAPIAYDENGSAITPGDLATTNTTPAGISSAGENCSNWTGTAAGPSLILGAIGNTAGAWSNGSNGGACVSVTFHIYCFGIP